MERQWRYACGDRAQAALSKCLAEVGRIEVKDTTGGLENLECALLADDELVGGQGIKCSPPWPASPTFHPSFLSFFTQQVFIKHLLCVLGATI